MVRLWRFERQAYSSGGCRSIQLSYKRTMRLLSRRMNMPAQSNTVKKKTYFALL